MFQSDPSTTEADRLAVRRWLAALEAALSASDAAALRGLFLEDGHWRDVVAFTWSITPVATAAAIAATLSRRQGDVQARRFEIAAARPAPRRTVKLGRTVVEAFFSFTTDAGDAEGVVRLAAPEDGDERPKAWVCMTALGGLRRRPCAQRSSGSTDILIVGAGQSGLALAARLEALGARYLAVERSPRVGDSWRRRYRSLVLHNPTCANHMPHIPFPKDYPRFLPKDLLADWLEDYAAALRLNVETGATVKAAQYDEAASVWRVELEGRAGPRIERPRHLVFAAGAVNRPIVPDLPGIGSFGGETLHADDYRDGAAWAGKRALVVGAANSGLDIAADLHRHGCATTVVQRGPTTVVSVEPSDRLTWSAYEEGDIDDVDLSSLASVYPLALQGARLAARYMADLDREMLDGLRARGFKCDLGEDATGHILKNRRRNGGYYLDTGCAQLIIDGKIKVLPRADIDRFIGCGARLRSGDVAPADVIVYATGYETQIATVRRILGAKIARRVGRAWGVGPDGEFENLWKPTAQPGLWFMAGSLAQARIYSKYLALQLVAACDKRRTDAGDRSAAPGDASVIDAVPAI